MTNGTQPRRLSAILCADWGKEAQKRAVYVADVSARVVRRVSADRWSVAGVFAEAERWTSTGSVLAAFDAPLGVPESYLTALGRLPHAAPMETFLDLLTRARSMPRFYDATTVARDWIVERPFFSVPAGGGGLGGYVDAAARLGVEMYRQIDRMTGAKAVFIKSGIPGSVGSAACALWQELASQLTRDRTFKIWPFEGELQDLLQSTSVVVGEMYPRAAYATALLEAPPTSRAPMFVAKTDAGVRREAIATLRAARWVRSLSVELEDLAQAEANEDDFDACVTAASLLRCVLEGAPLCRPRLESAASEGGMLGTGSVNLQLPQRTFPRQARERPLAQPTVRTARKPVEPGRSDASLVRADVGDAVRVFRCPIAGCDKVFLGSRGGWDGHVGSLRLHPNWHPELEEAAARKRRFETEFPMFFR
ncbi:MAG: hypothetical protein ABI837_01380 [Acidobacteriota bacterium]